jgi:hypothetical protein
LREEANVSQGMKSKGLQQPVSTPEMISIAERLEEPRKKLVQDSAKRLVLINNISHALLLVLALFGIRFREVIGMILLAPFGWIFSVTKKAHQKV